MSVSNENFGTSEKMPRKRHPVILLPPVPLMKKAGPPWEQLKNPNLMRVSIPPWVIQKNNLLHPVGA